MRRAALVARSTRSAFYSDMVDLTDDTFGPLYGNGTGHSHLPDRVDFRTLTLDYLLNEDA